jgi:hypothetical protein
MSLSADDAKTVLWLYKVYSYAVCKLSLTACKAGIEATEADGMNGCEYIDVASRRVVLLDALAEENIAKVNEQAVSVAEWIRGPQSSSINREYDPLKEMGDAVEVILKLRDAFKWVCVPGPFVLQGFTADNSAVLVKDGTGYIVKSVCEPCLMDVLGDLWKGEPLDGFNCVITPFNHCLCALFEDEKEQLRHLKPAEGFEPVDVGTLTRLSAMFDIMYHPCAVDSNDRRDAEKRRNSDAVERQSQADACANCGKTEGLKECGKCKAVKYCGVECQKKQWGSHKLVCSAIEDMIEKLGGSTI